MPDTSRRIRSARCPDSRSPPRETPRPQSPGLRSPETRPHGFARSSRASFVPSLGRCLPPCRRRVCPIAIEQGTSGRPQKFFGQADNVRRVALREQRGEALTVFLAQHWVHLAEHSRNRLPL